MFLFSSHLVCSGFKMIIDSMTHVALAPCPASRNAVKVVQTSQLHACTFHLALTFILHGSAFGLSVFRCWCVKLRYACLTDTCVSPSQSNLAVDCATESWLYMSGKERERKKWWCGWANTQRQRWKGRLGFEQAHYVNTHPKEMFLFFVLFVLFCLCVLKKKHRQTDYL